MQYLDPFELLQISPQDLKSPEAEVILRKARQRIMGQFELNEGMPIQFQGHSIDKSMVLDLLEQLANAEKRQMHLSIHENADLHQCLNNPNTHAFSRFFQDNQAERLPSTLISLLATAFADALQRLLKSQNWSHAGRLLELATWFSEEQSTAIVPAIQKANLAIESLKERTEKGADAVADSTWWMGLSLTFIFMMNALPQQAQGLRNLLGQQLDEFARKVAPQKGGYELAVKALESAKSLRLDLAVSENLQFAWREVNKFKPKLWYQEKAFAVVLGLLISAGIIAGMILLDKSGKNDRQEVEQELYQLIEKGGPKLFENSWQNYK